MARVLTAGAPRQSVRSTTIKISRSRAPVRARHRTVVDVARRARVAPRVIRDRNGNADRKKKPIEHRIPQLRIRNYLTTLWRECNSIICTCTVYYVNIGLHETYDRAGVKNGGRRAVDIWAYQSLGAAVSTSARTTGPRGYAPRPALSRGFPRGRASLFVDICETPIVDARRTVGRS